MDDKHIVDLYWRRSEQAISETAAKYGSYCYTIAHGILHSHEDAEECVNDTYNEAWHSIPPHRPAVLSTFLGKIARRLAIDRFRYRSAEKRGGGELPLVLDELQDCIDGGENPVEDWEKQRLSEVIGSFVRSLPDTERGVFLCRYWYMNSISAIADRFGFSESKVKSMLMRTREKLRILLIKEGFQ